MVIAHQWVLLVMVVIEHKAGRGVMRNVKSVKGVKIHSVKEGILMRD